MSRSANKCSHFIVCAMTFTSLLLSGSGCVGAQTRITVPRCVERMEVTGEHTKVGDDTLVLNHGFDLPLTSTDVTIARTDGTTESVSLTNTMPDVVHLVGAALIGSVSLLLVGLYAYQVGVAGEDVLGPSVWSAPIGAFGLLFTGALLVTGWHPPSDVRLETPCEN